MKKNIVFCAISCTVASMALGMEWKSLVENTKEDVSASINSTATVEELYAALKASALRKRQAAADWVLPKPKRCKYMELEEQAARPDEQTVSYERFSRKRLLEHPSDRAEEDIKRLKDNRVYFNCTKDFRTVCMVPSSLFCSLVSLTAGPSREYHLAGSKEDIIAIAQLIQRLNDRFGYEYLASRLGQDTNIVENFKKNKAMITLLKAHVQDQDDTFKQTLNVLGFKQLSLLLNHMQQQQQKALRSRKI